MQNMNIKTWLCIVGFMMLSVPQAMASPFIGEQLQFVEVEITFDRPSLGLDEPLHLNAVVEIGADASITWSKEPGDDYIAQILYRVNDVYVSKTGSTVATVDLAISEWGEDDWSDLLTQNMSVELGREASVSLAQDPMGRSQDFGTEVVVVLTPVTEEEVEALREAARQSSADCQLDANLSSSCCRFYCNGLFWTCCGAEWCCCNGGIGCCANE